jgi:hypothetical protein
LLNPAVCESERSLPDYVSRDAQQAQGETHQKQGEGRANDDQSRYKNGSDLGSHGELVATTTQS